MNFSSGNFNTGQAGMSLVETLIATTVSLLVLGGLLTVVTVVAKEQRREMVSAHLQQEANLLEDKITRLLREMSGTQAVILGNPLTQGSPFCRSIVVARGPAPSPREKVLFSPQSFTCTYTPDINLSSRIETYFAASSVSALRDMYFFISAKPDGAPDSSAITVCFQMDDNGMGRLGKTNTVVRSFTATMRNN